MKNGSQPKPASSFWSGILKSMGMVFGDIGTSPIYTLTVIFALVRPEKDNVLGILSLIVWTLILLVTVEYAWLAMSLGRKGEGGTIVLKEILVRLLRYGRGTALVGFLSFIGVSLLLGDGVITPAISILSAVEGIILIPGLEGLRQGALIGLAAAIAIGLFVFQYQGTDKVARVFGPVMALWFASLSLSGLVSLAGEPSVLLAVNPLIGVKFLAANGLAGFFVLSEVVLCATGGEALYADMGHLGRRPIIRAWYFVFAALVLNYLGQGAFLLSHPGAARILFSMVMWQAPSLYIPFLLLTVAATVIASQALISGVFSIVYQGITTRIMPLMKVDFTSSRLKSQIYIGAVNWILMLTVIFVILLFRRSENLAAAYGLAVTGTMTITGIMLTWIYSRTIRTWKVPIAAAVTLVDAAFLLACFEKIPHGGYWSLILAAVPFGTILLWTRGQHRLYRALRPLDMETFLASYRQIHAKGHNIPGTALFFTRETDSVPPYIVHSILRANIIYERNVFFCLVRTDEPFGSSWRTRADLAPGLEVLELRPGYMEVPDIEKFLKDQGIREKVIFYGVEDIVTGNPLWKIFAGLKRATPNFVQFHRLPAGKLQGVVTRVEM